MNQGADIYSKLQSDHEAASKLLQQLVDVSVTSTEQRETLFTELKGDLTSHSEAEDEVFYAHLLHHSETRDLVREGQHEHERIKALLDDLERMEKDNPLWRARLQTLKDTVEHHVHEEEGEIFTKARNILTTEQAAELGQRFEQAKRSPTMAAGQRPSQAASTSTLESGQRSAQATASSTVEEGQQKASSMLHEQQRFYASQLGGVAEALHKTAHHLGEQDQQGMAQYVGQAAEGLERFSQHLESRDLRSLVGQVEDFARRQPVAFVSGAALLGLLTMRFLKSSAHPSSPSHRSFSASEAAAAKSGNLQSSSDPLRRSASPSEERVARAYTGSAARSSPYTATGNPVGSESHESSRVHGEN